MSFTPWSRHLYRLNERSWDVSLFIDDDAIDRLGDLNPRWPRGMMKSEIDGLFGGRQVMPRTILRIERGGSIPYKEQLSEMGLVAKPEFGTQGFGVLKYSPGEDFHAWVESVEELAAERIVLVTELLEQGSYAKEIWPNSSNTIRVISFIDSHGKCQIASAVHRWGSTHSGFVDNWMSGGFSTHIDVKSGVMLNTVEDFTTLEQRSGEGSTREPLNPGRYVEYTTHPESGVLIFGKSIPWWDVVIFMVELLGSEIADRAKYVGWDIIVTETGPRLIELNVRPGLRCIQVHGPIQRTPALTEFLNEHI